MKRHWVTVPLTADGFFAVCSCGWRSEEKRAEKTLALDDASLHVKTVNEAEKEKSNE